MLANAFLKNFTTRYIEKITPNMIHLRKFSHKIRTLLYHVFNRRIYQGIIPNSTTKVYLPNPAKKRIKMKQSESQLPYVEKTLGPRKNRLDIQMLSKAVYDQIFIEGYKDTCNVQTIEQCQKELLKHNMCSSDKDLQKDVNLKIPPLHGKNIEEHFKIIGEEQVLPYRDLVSQLLENLPKAPEKWLMQNGWTRYAPGLDPEKVPYPLEEALVFDVEVCMMAGKAPTLATAVSNKAWYAWVSPSVRDGTYKPVTHHEYPLSAFIPMESSPGDTGLNLTEYQIKPKVIIGHNVCFDRARIKEQYWLKRTGTRFIDTMSLHICVGGVTSYQRAVLKSQKFIEEDEDWKNCSSLNNLVDVYKLYCGKSITKTSRDIFVEGTMSDVKENFQQVMTYCAGDVIATYEILKELFPMFLERFPHPVTLAGMLELSTAYLPVNSNWPRYVQESEQVYEDLEREGKLLLARRADQACQLLHNEKYKEDLWMWDQDWTVKDIKLKTRKKQLKQEEKTVETVKVNNDENEGVDPLEEKFKCDSKECVPSNTPLPGYPNWYRKLCPKPDSSPGWVPRPTLISTSMQITPKLLSLTWEGYPLHYIRGKGWGFLVPFTDDVDVPRKVPLKQLIEKCPLLPSKDGSNSSEVLHNIQKSVEEHLMKKEYYARLKQNKAQDLYKGSGIWCNTVVEDCCWFFKLPHKDGPSHNVGNPLAKDFLSKFADNVLGGDTESAEKVMEIAKQLSYWRNNRNRILDQMVVWLDKANLPKELQKKGDTYGAILPQIVMCGTLTRRAVEPTWMTASNANKDRIGSELRAMVQAPPGYNIVGADVDSQELWIASVLGDAHHAKMHGSTPLGWMTLSGSKTAGTDMHSVTAKAVGISRDHAKVINYARIYGAGQHFAERLLKQFNPSMSETEARSKAKKMFTLTKGRKVFFLKQEYLQEFADQPYTKWQAFETAKACGKTVDEMFLRSKWVGGTESAMFNRLEEIANSEEPCTPFLKGRLSRALDPKTMAEDRYLPTRVNWVVQSGAVDFLHLMLVCMKWILGDNIRFCLSFHDEVRYLVPEPYKYQAALALHVTNLLTRSFCSYRLGLNDLPQSVAFFSSVEVDKVLRKESKQDCITPSNPLGLSKGYGIENGEALNIYEAIDKAGGDYMWWGDRRSEKKRNVKIISKKAGAHRSTTR
ncbi:DNA polymerase subunit gamma-1, mitochondrial [Anoplophora glabripennis]|uniref:DNA polymerase subunit gamma-1, mitochondrial n=1 Tax=Anoplophora glabripennis TaxID=217634 RepID=UPI0008754924|nr:DNA polymerase subunit gamma-1, mitochondrial [Anoplophora glabripennis]XP_018560903.1 DNA polymerase subunit gamma-1, mitochondrial [Anoplophora glabripennis]